MDLTLGVLAGLGLAVCLGALVQSSVGFGVGLVAAPVVIFLDPTLMPVSLLVVGTALPLFMLRGEWRHVDRPGLVWALSGRLPGIFVGVYVVSVFSSRQLGVVVAVTILAAVAVSLRTIQLRRTPTALVLAGAVSGVTGTAAAIGGPPLGLVYAREPGPTVRMTLAAYFLVGGLASLAGLAMAGQVELRALVAGLLVIPFTALGNALAKPVTRRLDRGHLRSAILAVAVLSAVVLLVRSIL